MAPGVYSRDSDSGGVFSYVSRDIKQVRCMTETLTVAGSTVISPLGTSELRISLGSDRGGVESYYLGSDK